MSSDLPTRSRPDRALCWEHRSHSESDLSNLSIYQWLRPLNSARGRHWAHFGICLFARTFLYQLRFY
jgi:hypothetical protein